MKLKFTKMQGAGNDFVVFDCTKTAFNLTTEQIRKIADRHFGIGADQILVVESSEKPDIDFRYRIFNADGREVEQCGNGARCFVRFVNEKGLCNKKKIRVQTTREVIEPELLDNGMVKVNMGTPSFEPDDLPFIPGALPSKEISGVQLWAIPFKSRLWWFMPSSMGNPHVTIIVEDDISQAPVSDLGPYIENHPAFPRRVNVGFLQIQDAHTGHFRVWERGTGETLACGTGNCAAAACAVQQGLMQSPVCLSNRGGTLTIEWEGEGMDIELSGPAETTFDGEIDI